MSRRFVMLSLLLLAGLGVIAAASAGSEPAARIEGVVVTGDGSPIAGARVLYNNVSKLERDGMGRLVMREVPIRSSVRTDAGGKFSIPGLPAGSYYLCASGTKSNHLRSCEWDQPSMRVELSEAQRLGGVRLLVAEGTMLVFRVRDARGVIQDTAAGPVVDGRLPLAGGNFRIGVMSGLRYAEARFAAQDGDVREYAVAVPKDASLRVVADTPLSIRDAAGRSVQTREPSFAVKVSGESRLAVALEVE
ncbi:MAG: carboxypeptidase regulatory-like domain-containing protein [Bryobacteraceae bacterium]